MTAQAPGPGVAAAGLYPERTERQQAAHPLERLIPRRSHSLRQLKHYAERVLTQLAAQQTLGLEELQQAAQALRTPLRSQGLSDELAVQAFALTCRAIQLQLGLTPRKVQIIGAWIMLRGNLAEMQTGEGKTLAATLPASAVALAGIPVHVITANDYLAGRDAQNMQPVYQALGLSAAAIAGDMDDSQRRRVYADNIAYCSGQQLVFDYLRDRVTGGDQQGGLRLALEELYHEQPRKQRLLLRGLFYAIVDEADSVLIDEARTPLLLSRSAPGKLNKSLLVTALYLARKLSPGVHFRLDYRERRVQLTPQGRRQLEQLCSSLDGFWQGPRRRHYLVAQALHALHLLIRDRDYLLRKQQVEIIDAGSGRPMPERAWAMELHALVELKEGLKPSGQRENLARLTFQRFYRRYLSLAGMSGTLREVRHELKRVYRLGVVEVPMHRPSQLRKLGTRFLASRQQQEQLLIKRVHALRQQHRAILIGTRSVTESEQLARGLQQAGIPFALLNARQDRQEATVISEAGQPGQVTIATNMAGRGTDIALHPRVAEAGGLHVIVCEINDARRIDRQLFGRAARQGQPGSYEMLLRRDDDMLLRHVPAGLRGPLAALSPRLLLRAAQGAEERYQAHLRHRLLQEEDRLGEHLAFSGSGE